MACGSQSCPATSPRPGPLCGALPQPSPASSRGPSLLCPAQGAQHHLGGALGDPGWGGEGKSKTTRCLRRNCHLRLHRSWWRVCGTGASGGLQIEIGPGGCFKPPSHSPSSTTTIPGRACSAARFDHSWGGRVFLPGSAWTAKELLEKSQAGWYLGVLAHMAGRHHTGCPPGFQPYTAPDGIYLTPRQHDASPREEERGPNTRQSTDLHCTSIIPVSCPPPSAAVCWAHARVQSGPSSSLPQARGCQDSRGEPTALQIAWPQGHQRLLGTPWAGVSCKPYQAL